MITPQQSGNLQVKPKWQLPVGVMEGIVAYNCRKYGFPRPVLAMPIWEKAGNRTMDLSGNGNHGALTNGPDWVADGLDFDGTSNYVDLDTIQFINSNTPFTVWCWIYLDSFNYDFPAIFSTKSDLDSGNNWRCWFSDNATYGFIAFGSQGEWVRLKSQDIPSASLLGKWYHVVINYNGQGAATSGNFNLYINGTQQNTIAMGAIGTINTNSMIGRAGIRYWDGNICAVSVFNSALSAAQVKFLYDNPYFMFQIPEELYGYVAPLPSVSGSGAYFARREQWCGITV